ncbi:MAG: amidohydrolase family protein [Candidatus Solibacter usitatus]|nr:amidohydrolase family protein [Candidatus Solibacter usitatus]
MWIRKADRDRKKNVISPMPTQLVSNEEFIPRPQSLQQKNVEHLITELSEVRSKKLGMDRRAFMATSMGMATCFLASNKVWGEAFEVDEAETWEPEASAEKWPKGEFFVMDVQAHFTDGYALNFRNSEFVKNMGFQLTNDKDSYSFRNFVKEMYFDSETDMVVISGVPGREKIRDDQGGVPEMRARGGGVLPSWLMAYARDEINRLSGSTRAVSQGNLAPNHYWDKVNNKPDKAALLEQMDRELTKYKISSWKWYCHTDPGGSGGGFQLDDDNAAMFYEESRKRGLKIISVHKGYSYQSRTLGHLANPKDVEKAALNNPDFTFIVYHSAIQHGPTEPNWLESNKYDATTGDFMWHQILMDIKKRNPNMKNVHCEIGSFFGPLVIANPTVAMHGIGKNIKYYGSDHVIWGTDCLWWGSPQWVVDAFKRFQISDEMCDKFGYKKITKQDKANIFGLNAAKIYGIDLKKARKPLAGDALDKLKLAYLDQGGQRSNDAYGWVRADD